MRDVHRNPQSWLYQASELHSIPGIFRMKFRFIELSVINSRNTIDSTITEYYTIEHILVHTVIWSTYTHEVILTHAIF